MQDRTRRVSRPKAATKRTPKLHVISSKASEPDPQALITDVTDNLGTDFYLVDELLTRREREIRDKVRRFADTAVLPIINDYWERAEFPFELVPKLAQLGIAGGTIKGYGCPGLSPVAVGLIGMELSRGDGSMSTFFGVHSGLAMQSIAMLGSPAQRERWLPPMARLEKIGAFALTEPEHGSDAILLETAARRDSGDYVLTGSKRWIGNGSIADVVVVWARDEDGGIGAFLVEKGTPGYEARVMTGKISKRAVWQAEITLDGVRVPAANRLARSKTFKDTGRVLTATRYGVAWEALGHALACYEAAVTYTKERTQFGKPLASFQMIQNRLAWMLAEITGMQLICHRLSVLASAGKMTPGMASIAKMNNARKARGIAASAREMLGGNGILLDYHVARHLADMEAVFTYEGTDTIQSLIVGREITGEQAFA
jgi:glutaryl-CoA dehydrogenase